MDDAESDQRLEHRRSPNVPVTVEELRELGVLYWKLDADLCQTDGSLERICNERGYKNRDEVFCEPGKLPDYENKIKTFYREHLHEDEEIRLILGGTGFFDVRGKSDEWIRVKVTRGDLLVLPAGIYHRFTMDSNDCTHAMRLFKEAPRWVAINRPADENQVRQEYVNAFIAAPRRTDLGVVVEGVNELVNLPHRFDEDIARIIKRAHEAHRGAKVFLIAHFTGVKSDVTGTSWCSDCTRTEPFILPVVQQVLDSNSETRSGIYVACPVERTSYKNNASYLYRVHDNVRIRCIPSVLLYDVTAGSLSGPVWRFDDIGEDLDWARAMDEMRSHVES